MQKKARYSNPAHFNYETLAEICDILSNAGKLNLAARAVVRAIRSCAVRQC